MEAGGSCGYRLFRARWRFSRPPLLGLECFHSPYDDCRFSNARESAASVRPWNFGNLFARISQSPPGDRHCHRIRGSNDHRASVSSRRRCNSAKRAGRKYPGHFRGRYSGRLLCNWASRSSVARSMGVRGNRVRILLCGAPRTRTLTRSSALSDADSRACDFRRTCARSNAAWTHGDELGAQVYAGIRRQPPCPW